MQNFSILSNQCLLAGKAKGCSLGKPMGSPTAEHQQDRVSQFSLLQSHVMCQGIRASYYLFFSEEGAKLIEEDFPSCSCALASHSFPPRLTSEAARGCETQSKSGSIMAGRRRCSRLEKPCPPRNTALLLSCDTKVEACYQVVT